jgi:hypothetical protein
LHAAISGGPWDCPNQSKIRINPHKACAVHQSINMRKYSCRNFLLVHPSTIQIKVLTLRMRLGCMVSITRKAPSKEFSIDVCPTFLQSLQLHHITARIHVNNFRPEKRYLLLAIKLIRMKSLIVPWHAQALPKGGPRPLLP